MFASCNTPKRPRIRAKNIIEGKQSIAAKFASCNTPERPHIRAKKHKTRQAVHRCNVRQLQHPKKTAHSRKKTDRQTVHRCKVRQLQHPKRPRIRAKKHNRQAVHRCKVRQLQCPKKTAHSHKKVTDDISDDMISLMISVLSPRQSNHTRLVDFNASLLESPFLHICPDESLLSVGWKVGVVFTFTTVERRLLSLFVLLAGSATCWLKLMFLQSSKT